MQIITKNLLECWGFISDSVLWFSPSQTAFATANEEKVKNAKLKQKKRKIKTEQKQMHEDNCFQCGDGGELVMCDKKDCPKAYHLLCLNLTQPPFGKNSGSSCSTSPSCYKTVLEMKCSFHVHKIQCSLTWNAVFICTKCTKFAFAMPLTFSSTSGDCS